MKDKYFIDTNVFVYSFDQKDDDKRRKSNELIKNALLNHNGCISSQVIQEFINVATRKFISPMSIQDCEKYLKNVLSPLCQVFTSLELYHKALDIMERWQFSLYDSLIIAASLQADCKFLYSEDLQHKQKIQSLTIVNPFL
ncbi:MAG: PIN domain-containing protein [Deltaproteobacteria bacterium]|nr:PIN domain-containing protein [Deltaproteobacteria bacterium]MBW1815543.1 PIN domain-containing protein [Deltaproteobacteria bacterium]